MKVHTKPLHAFAPIALLVLVASIVVVVPSAHAATTYNIQIGTFLGGPDCNPETGQGCVPGEGQRFYGGGIRVMSGDTVHFTTESFHTATLLPKNVDVASWVPENAQGVDKPYSFISTDPDDTAIDDGAGPTTPSLKANLAALLPSSFLCGSAATPCPHDGSTVTNSGVPQEGPLEFSATIVGAPGDTIWVVCLVHTHMRQKITITSDPAQASTQPAIDAAAESQMELDDEQAASLHKQMLNAKSSHTTASGKKVTDVQVGVDTHWISLLGMYPKVASIKKGETVRFHFGSSSVYEDHTASMSFNDAIEVFNQTFFPPWCDPDGDAGAGPDNPAENQTTFCNDPTQVEFDIPAMAAWTQGDGTFNGSGYENSGFRGAEAMNISPWDVKFTKASNAKGYKYFCLIHGPFMGGRIKVSD